MVGKLKPATGTAFGQPNAAKLQGLCCLPMYRGRTWSSILLGFGKAHHLAVIVAAAADVAVAVACAAVAAVVVVCRRLRQSSSSYVVVIVVAPPWGAMGNSGK